MKHRATNDSAPFGGRQVRALTLMAVLALAAASGVARAITRFGAAEPAPIAARAAAPAEPAARDAAAAADSAPPAAQALAAAAGPAWDLPNLDHERVDYFVGLFSGKQRKLFTRYLNRMGHYQPMISAKLAERGMPQDLIYLAMIESGFNPQAYSHAHASGLWQFIAATGRRYGLDINRAVDERNDPEKATDAALDYLEDLHEQFGSWYLAAAAYNSGEGRVARVMRQTTGSVRGDEHSYYRIRSRLPRETRDYVPLMVAAARIAKEPARYGFDDVALGEPLAFDTVEVAPATPLESIALAAGTTTAEIRRLNPQLRIARTRNDRPDVIRIPPGTRAAFAANWPVVRQRQLARAEAPATSAPAVKRYRIRRGDNLTRIARRHGVSIHELKRANNLRGDRIRAGSTLRIPSGR